MSELIGAQGVANLLNCAKQQVYEWEKLGLPMFSKGRKGPSGGNKYLVSEIREWAEEHQEDIEAYHKRSVRGRAERKMIAATKPKRGLRPLCIDWALLDYKLLNRDLIVELDRRGM